MEVTRATEPLQAGPILSTADVLFVAGIPGWAADQIEKVFGQERPFPEETPEIEKLLHEQGVRTDYLAGEREQALVGFKSADFLAPIMVVTHEAAISGAGAILASVIMERVRQLGFRRSRLHVKVGKMDSGQLNVEWFEASGDAEDVLQAMREALDVQAERTE